MRTITARIGGKTYTATAITTATARETIRVMEELEAARQKAELEELKDGEVNA